MDFEITCPAVSEALGTLRHLIVGVAQDSGFDEEHVEQIEMAVDEACANVVKHAYSDRTHQTPKLLMRIVISRDSLKITVTDKGVGLANMPIGASSVKEYLDRGAQGGLGLYIIRNFMDEVEYDSPPQAGTTLHMTKYRRPVHAPA